MAETWAVRGITKEFQQTVKDHAKKQGMTVGAFLVKVINEAITDTAQPTPYREIIRRLEALERLTTSDNRAFGEDKRNEVIRLKGEGMANRKIADRIGVSASWVQKVISENTPKLL